MISCSLCGHPVRNDDGTYACDHWTKLRWWPYDAAPLLGDVGDTATPLTEYGTAPICQSGVPPISPMFYALYGILGEHTNDRAQWDTLMHDWDIA